MNVNDKKREVAKTNEPAKSYRCVDSQELFNGSNAIEIIHHNTRYILRITKENKLILTK
jgi:hemin uptake protein HemP